MKGVIIYKSKYGATAQYAKWLSAELKLGYFETNDVDNDDLNEYDYLILGTSIYFGKMLLEKWLKAHLAQIGNKTIFLFAVCGTPLDQKDKLNTYVTSSVPEEIRNKCNIFFLPGKLKIKELSLLDNFILKMGAKLAKSPAVKKAMLTDYNAVKKENLLELTKAVKRATIVNSKMLVQESIK
jgi:menaquinone-dependent protoporphyrinogen IX oxidase